MNTLNISKNDFILCTIIIAIVTFAVRRNHSRNTRDWIQLDAHVAFMNPIDQNPCLKKFVFPRDMIEIHSEIGRGEFGVVYKATLACKSEQENGTEVAVKVSKKDINSLVTIANELALIMKLQKIENQTHPNIIQCIGCIVENAKEFEVFLITELCHGGNMKSFIEKNCYNFNIKQFNKNIGKSINSSCYKIKQR